MYNYREDMEKAPKKIVYVCRRCKEDDVSFSACVRWDFKKQKFVLITDPPFSLDNADPSKNTGLCYKCDPDTDLGDNQEIDVITVYD